MNVPATIAIGFSKMARSPNGALEAHAATCPPCAEELVPGNR